MHSSNDTATTNATGATPAASLTRAVELLANRCGVRLEPRQAWEAAADGIASGRGDPLRVFGLAARRAGVLVSRPREPSNAGQLRELGSPAVTWIPSGDEEGRWLIVLDQRRRTLELAVLDDDGERRHKVSVGQLGAWLEREFGAGASRLRWLRAEPLLPLASIESRTIVGDGSGRATAVRRLLAIAKLERGDIGVVLVYALAVGSMTLAVPVAVQALVNTVAFGSVLQPIVVLSLLLALALGFVAILRVLQAVVVESIQQRLFVRAAADFARRLPRLSAAAHKNYHGPELANRLFDAVALQKTGATLLMEGLALLLQMAVGLALLAFYHPTLLAFALVLVVAVTIVILVPFRRAVATSLIESDRKYAVAAWIEDLAGNPLRFADARSRAFADARAEVLIREWLHARQQHFTRVLRQLASGVGLQVIASTALLGLGGWLVVQRQLTLGQLIAAEIVVAAIGDGLGKLGKHLESFYDAATAAAKLGKVVDMPLEHGGGELLADTGPLSVSIRRRSDDAMLLSLAPGEKLGLLGRTPANSALFNALFGLTDDPGLDVRVDGCSIRGLDLEALRGEVALVRGIELVAGSIRDNLDPRPIPSDGAAVRAVLDLVGLGDRVSALPEGLATPMLPSGAPLEMAEARCLMLGQAMLREPRLLLIDGGLDGLGLASDTHDRLVDSLFATDAPWTLIVISDDPELLRHCTTRASS
jgi:putative ABC transport system ATP-binding protein